MNQETKEELIFSALMTIGMVLVMLSYNIILISGFTLKSLIVIITQFIPIFIAAFIVEQLVVSHNVHKLHKMIVSPSDPEFKHILVMSILMATSMSLLMTMYTTLIHVGTEDHFWQHYITAWLRNYPVALIAQLLVVGPAIRSLYIKVFKHSTLVS